MPRTGSQLGASGQSPQLQRSAESQQAGRLSFAASMLRGVAASPGKFIWNGDPAFGNRLSLTCGLRQAYNGGQDFPRNVGRAQTEKYNGDATACPWPAGFATTFNGGHEIPREVE